MSGDHEITLVMTWDQDRRKVRTTVLDAAGPIGPVGPAAHVGPALQGTRPLGPTQLSLLGKALFPTSVRSHVVSALRSGKRLRIRLRLPAPSEQERVALGSLFWERVQVPVVDVGAPGDQWARWVAGEERVGVLRDLGDDPRFSLLREVTPVSAVPPFGNPDSGLVLVADAAAVHGDLVTAEGVLTIPEPRSGTVGQRDALRVESALKNSHFDTRTVPSPATGTAIRDALPGALVFYFGGHHVAGGLVVADEADRTRGRLLDEPTLSHWLTDNGVTLVVLMACDSASPSTNSEPAGRYSLAENLARHGIPYVVAVHGTVTDEAAAQFAYGFFKSLAAGESVDFAARGASAPLTAEKAVPQVFTSVGTSGEAWPDRLAHRPAILSSAAYRMPVLFDQGDRNGLARPDERFRTHLETRWCLTAADFCEVLADPSGDDLPALLRATEMLLHRAARDAAMPGVPWRRWYAYEAEPGRPPRTAAELGAKLTPAYQKQEEVNAADRGVGLVVRKLATGPREPDWPSYLDELRRFMRRLLASSGRDPRPELAIAIVIQVHGGQPELVRSFAEQIAHDLTLHEYLLRARYLGVGQDGVDRPDRFRHAPAAAAAKIDAEQLRAMLLRARAGEIGDAPQFDAADVVRYLNSTGGWGDVSEESAALEWLRAHWPDSFRELMRAHAANRRGPALYASLWAAAATDADMRAWLRSARRRLPRPTDFPLVQIPPQVVDTVVLGMIHEKMAETPELDDWHAESDSAAVTAAVTVARRNEPITCADIDWPEHAVALDRAGLLAGIDLRALDPEGRCAGSWSLLTRRQMAEDDAAWVFGMLPARRRLVGWEPATSSYDVTLEEKLTEYRAALRPPLPVAGSDLSGF